MKQRGVPAWAARMNVARTTVTAICDSARKKIAQALVRGKRLLITGGCCEYAPVTVNQTIAEKGNSAMRIAVTCDNGEIFQHFGHTGQFKLYDVQGGMIVGTQVADTNGSGRGRCQEHSCGGTVFAVSAGSRRRGHLLARTAIQGFDG